MRTKSRPVRAHWRRWGKTGAADPARFQLHDQDETHPETNPYLGRVWRRRGVQSAVPAAGANRRVTVFGSVALVGRGRVEVVPARQDSAGFLRCLDALEAHWVATGREVDLVLDNGSCHTSKVSRAALAERAAWLHVVWLARSSPQFNSKERAWRYLKRDARSHRARTLCAFVDEIVTGPRGLGGERCDVFDEIPDWFIAGHRRPPTGRPPGARDSRPRALHRHTVPAST